MLQNELNAATLPCTVTPGGTLTVDKTTDKTTPYNVGDTVTFTILVTNPSTSFTSYRTGIVDTPPVDFVTCPSTTDTYNLGPGESHTWNLECTALKASCTPVTNAVTATGWSDPSGGVPVFVGSAGVGLTIVDSSCNPLTGVPEFPSIAVPVGAALGMLFVVMVIRGKKD